jgi:hypothetical protein
MASYDELEELHLTSLEVQIPHADYPRRTQNKYPSILFLAEHYARAMRRLTEPEMQFDTVLTKTSSILRALLDFCNLIL